MEMTKGMALALAVAPLLAFAQQGGRDAFIRQQAFAEMQRVSGQVDVLQTNFDDLQRRVGKLEAGGGEQAMRAEIESLKAAVAELRRELAAQRGEIVKDLTDRIVKMQPKEPPAPPRPPRETVVKGPTSTYTVASGDNLYLIANAFKTTVAKLRELNGLKSDKLRIGQKLIVPQAN